MSEAHDDERAAELVNSFAAYAGTVSVPHEVRDPAAIARAAAIATGERIAVALAPWPEAREAVIRELRDPGRWRHRRE